MGRNITVMSLEDKLRLAARLRLKAILLRARGSRAPFNTDLLREAAWAGQESSRLLAEGLDAIKH